MGSLDTGLFLVFVFCRSAPENVTGNDVARFLVAAGDCVVDDGGEDDGSGLPILSHVSACSLETAACEGSILAIESVVVFS